MSKQIGFSEKWILRGRQSSQGGNDVGIPGVRPHNLLSTAHPDTLPASPVRGDIVFANSTPVWARFPRGANPNQFLRSGTAGADPIWVQVPAASLSGTVAGSQLASPFGFHGHAPNSGFNPLSTASLAADATVTGTGVIVVTDGTTPLSLSLTGRDLSQGLNAFFGAILSVKASNTGNIFVFLDAAQYAGPFPINSTSFTTVTIYVPIFQGDALSHTMDIRASADLAGHTVTFSGTTFQSIVFAFDHGTGLNIA